MVFLYSRWMATSLGTRHKIADIFGFKKVGSTHVSDNKIVDDGFKVKDMEEAMTLDKLQDFLNNPSTDINYLFGLLVDVLEGRPPEVIIEPDPAIIAKPIEPREIEEGLSYTVTALNKPKKHGKTRKIK